MSLLTGCAMHKLFSLLLPLAMCLSCSQSENPSGTNATGADAVPSGVSTDAPRTSAAPDKQPAPDKPAVPEKPVAAGERINVILIGWDGAQRDHVKECLERGELPALKALAAEGKMVDIDIKEVTDTKAGWTQILTGYYAKTTGVYSNARFQPIPKGYTVFERLKKALGPENIVTVAVIGKKAHVDADPPRKEPVTDNEVEDKTGAGPDAAKVQAGAKGPKGAKIIEPGSTIVTEDGKKYREWPGKPWANAKDQLDFWQNGLGVNDNVGRKALEQLEKYKDKPFFFFVHFADVDHKGHGFGENSKEYNDALISSDKWTGKIIEKLKECKIYGRTIIYVTADHGFDEGQKSHRNAPYVFLATNDTKVMRGGFREDVAPTILERMGVDLAKLSPPLDGQALSKAAEKRAEPESIRGARKKGAGKGAAKTPAAAPAEAGAGGGQ
jgi:hypothetical protein